MYVVYVVRLKNVFASCKSVKCQREREREREGEMLKTWILEMVQYQYKLLFFHSVAKWPLNYMQIKRGNVSDWQRDT